MQRLAHHAVHNISTTGMIVLSNDMTIEIILLRLWYTNLLCNKRDQVRLP